MRLRTNLAADAALLLTTLIWGSTFVIAKELLTRWPPFAYLSFRFALASLAFALLFPRHIFRATREEWRAAITLGLLVGGGFALQTIGQVYTTPSKSAFITGLTTPLVPVIAYLLTGARPSRENAVGITLASLGGALILTPHEGGEVNIGDLITLASTICFALHIICMSLYARRHDIKRLSALQIGVAAVCFIALWPLESAVHNESTSLVWSGRVLWQIIYLALIATVLTFLLWTWGQARTSATHAAIIFSLEPVFATLFALTLRGGEEWFGLRGGLGAALVLVGVIVSELRWTERDESSDRVEELMAD